MYKGSTQYGREEVGRVGKAERCKAAGLQYELSLLQSAGTLQPVCSSSRRTLHCTQ